MNRFKGMLLGVALLALPAVARAQAQTITFDDQGGMVGIGDYAGFNFGTWFYRLDGLNYPWTSGYQNAVVSPNFVAFNNAAQPVSLSRANPFTFNGAYFTAAWHDGLQLNIIGRLGSAQMFNTTLTLTTSGPTWFAANWANIDALFFSSYGGAHHYGLEGDGDHFAMDNLTVNQDVVPEPATLLLLATGLAGIVGAARRRRQKSTEN